MRLWNKQADSAACRPVDRRTTPVAPAASSCLIHWPGRLLLGCDNMAMAVSSPPYPLQHSECVCLSHIQAEQALPFWKEDNKGSPTMPKTRQKRRSNCPTGPVLSVHRNPEKEVGPHAEAARLGDTVIHREWTLRMLKWQNSNARKRCKE